MVPYHLRGQPRADNRRQFMCEPSPYVAGLEIADEQDALETQCAAGNGDAWSLLPDQHSALRSWEINEFASVGPPSTDPRR